jgi:hypothetical protein
MNKYLFFLLLLMAFFACNKEGNVRLNSSAHSNSSVEFTDTVKIPINDLGTGTYLGFMGGLYPGGVDTPSGKYAKDLLRFASRITPLNSNGKPSDTGKIVFISLGVSTGGHNMYALIAKTTDNPRTNPFLLLANCNNGSGNASLNSIANPSDTYWDHVSSILNAHHITYKQVQVIYLETDDSIPIVSFPERPYQVRDDLKLAMQTCKAKFKHLKLVYVLGRTTTFNKFQVQNIEPCPYYNGWGEKFFIEDQINGAPGTQYKGDSAVAPLVTWGWYQWADGTTVPRQDGFVWTKDQTIDGLHADAEGQDTLATRFQKFLLTDKYASIWYANHTKPNAASK